MICFCFFLEINVFLFRLAKEKCAHEKKSGKGESDICLLFVVMLVLQDTVVRMSHLSDTLVCLCSQCCQKDGIRYI